MWVKHPLYSSYLVSDSGKVRHIKKDTDRKTRKDRYGYDRINIIHNGSRKTLTVHRLVAECYVLNNHNLETVNHIDGNKSNNCSSNLEWMTSCENVSDMYNRPHKKCVLVEIDGIKYRSMREAERDTGIKRYKFKDMPHIQIKG